MFDKKKKEAVVIVAHPDDETIFMGGTILTYPDWNWRIYSLTYSFDDPRGVQFGNAITYYRQQGVNVVDYECLGHKDSLERMGAVNFAEWNKSISKLKLSPDIVFTHNSIGEYKHNHHRILSEVVNQLFDNVWEFICPAVWRKQVVHQPFKEETKVIPLTPEILEQKTKIFNESYTSELPLWRTLPDVMRFEFNSGFEIFTK